MRQFLANATFAVASLFMAACGSPTQGGTPTVDGNGGTATVSGNGGTPAVGGSGETAGDSALEVGSDAGIEPPEVSPLNDFDCGDVGFEADNVALRGLLSNAKLAFTQTQKGRVAFMGGSITQMEGYRPQMMSWLEQQFPQTQFEFINAGLASTSSMSGAIRLEDHVLSHGKIDLFFVEFTVNDDQDAGHSYETAIRGLEGVIRRMRVVNPQADIVSLYFVNETLLQSVQDGSPHHVINAHDAVTQHYNVPAAHVIRELARRIADGTMTWEEYGGVHPALPGNTLAANMVQAILSCRWDNADQTEIADYPLPTALDPYSFFRQQTIALEQAVRSPGVELEIPNWAALPGSVRPDYVGLPFLNAEDPGDEITVDFSGVNIGAFVLAGPDAGRVEAVIDDGPPQQHDMYHAFSENLQYPRSVMFAEELPEGPHTLRLKVLAETSSPNSGTAFRAMMLSAGAAQ